MNPQAKAWLDEREDAAYGLLDQKAITELTDAALDSAERKLKSLTTTNCGWAIYRVRDALLREIDTERYRRIRAASKVPA